MNLRWLSLLAAFSLNAYAGPRAEVLLPRFYGTGCPKESADVSISANAKELYLNFARFALETENAVGTSSCSRECETTIPIRVPHGYSLAVKKVHYQGNYDLPYGSQATLTGTHFVNDDEIAAVSKRYYGRTDGMMDVQVRVPDYALSWSACGSEVVVSSRTKVALQAGTAVRKASFRIGEDPIATGIRYELLWRTCKQDD